MEGVTSTNLYIGNIDKQVTAEDLKQLLGTDGTEYLKSNTSVDLKKCEKTGESKGFAIVTVPEHVASELLNLNGIEFYNRQLVIEESKSSKAGEDKRPKKNTQQKGGRGQNRRGNYNQRRPNRYNTPNLKTEDQLNIIDCSANLTNPKFQKFGTEQVFARLFAAGVSKVIVTGLTLAGSKSAAMMADGRKGVCYAAIGCHPHFIKKDWNETFKKELISLASKSSVVAIGETGIDMNRNYSDVESCQAAFKAHIDIAIDVKKPLLVHERDAFEAVSKILDEKLSGQNLPVVIHCFTGSEANMKAYTEKGYYIGVTGYLCKETHGAALREMVKNNTLKLERIIVQSNAPYMMPNVNQQEIDPVSKVLLDCCPGYNEPCTLPIIVHTLSSLTGKSPQTVASILNENAKRVFGISAK